MWPSLYKEDGERRIRQIFEHIKSVGVDNAQKLMVYPGDDDRILRVVRKIVRGLSAHHKIEQAISDERVWADVLRYEISADLLNKAQACHCEADIVHYHYDLEIQDDISSAWVITFFQRTTFIAIVKRHSTLASDHVQ